MKFRYIGTPKNITDLRSIASKHKQLERKNVKIAIVDNESFPMIEILQRHKFDIDKFDDIENIESLMAMILFFVTYRELALNSMKSSKELT